MKGCNEIKRLIDEADQPGRFTFEVTGHISHCQDCSRFAHERASLRNLLASGARVTVPINFDAMLNARLAEAKARKTFSWLSPATLMRFGAATAGLVIALLVLQFTGMLSSPEQQREKDVAVVSAPSPAPSPQPQATLPPVKEPDEVSSPQPNIIAATPAHSSRVTPKAAALPQPPQASEYSGMEEGGVILVRGQNGEREVPLPTVSVGAQPLLYVNSTRPAPKSAGTSF